MSKKPLTYADSGVNLASWKRTKERINRLVSSTFTQNAIGQFGQFGGLFDVSMIKDYEKPVLVSSVDGVGTKLIIAREIDKHDSVGEDIVNHCVNDILVMGATPLFFLDYIGIGELSPEIIEHIVKGLVRACKKTNMVLIGGETAEMPDVYTKGEYDLAGTIVGVVERKKIIDGHTILPGDILIGLKSNGLHTNGYSLARKIVKEYTDHTLSDIFPETGMTIGEELLKPHISYIPLLSLMQKGLIKGCSHITGGGFQENINRILPKSCDAIINTHSWIPEPVFTFLQKNGLVENDEMYRTFNMGIGMTIIVSNENVDTVTNDLSLKEYQPLVIGRIGAGTGKVIMEY